MCMIQHTLQWLVKVSGVTAVATNCLVNRGRVNYRVNRGHCLIFFFFHKTVTLTVASATSSLPRLLILLFNIFVLFT